MEMADAEEASQDEGSSKKRKVSSIHPLSFVDVVLIDWVVTIACVC